MTVYSYPFPLTSISRNFRWGYHWATDFAQALGTPIPAPTDGSVRNYGSGVVMGYDYGHWMQYRATDGKYIFLAHMKNANKLPIGHTIHRGDTIGHVGQSGGATGPHLHMGFMRFSLSKVSSFNPIPYTKARLPKTSGAGGSTPIKPITNEEPEMKLFIITDVKGDPKYTYQDGTFVAIPEGKGGQFEAAFGPYTKITKATKTAIELQSAKHKVGATI